MHKILLPLALVVGLSAYAQTESKAFPEIVPPSPDAAALGKYGEIPVGTYTGIPDISIPLYQVQSAKVALPISISYHAGGIKVEDFSSNIGLGWSLNAGGVITRSIVGLPDNEYNGYFNNTLPADMENISNDDLQRIAENRLDSEPDEYFFNFGIYSGKLVFKKDGTCLSIPHNKFRIKPAVGPANQGTAYWEITTEEGTTYTFAATETSTVQSVCAMSGGFPMDSYDQLTFVSSWYLTKIQSPYTNQFITLNYLQTTFEYDTKGGSSSTYPISGYTIGKSSSTSYCATHISMSSTYVHEIQFPGGKIVFDAGYRSDLVGAIRIKSMTVFDYHDVVTKKYSFDNDQYFESGCNADVCKRLKLDAVTELGKNGAQLPPYQFEYNSEVLPPRDSYDTDHWGFYNKKGNTYGFPELIDYSDEYSALDYLPGDIKKSDPDALKAGVLTKIIYPTGGYTNFEYEINEVVSVRLPNKTTGKIVKRIDGPGNKESTPFTIQGYSQSGLWIVARYQTIGCSISSIPSIEDNCPYTQIIGVNGTIYETVFQSGTIKETRFFLPNGQYKLTGSSAGFGQSYFITVEIEPEVNSPNKFAGGLRVSKISDFDGSNPSGINVRRFLYSDDAGASTGRISNFPVYKYIYSRYAPYDIWPCPLTTWLTRTQQSNTTLGTTRSSYVGYGRVVELRGEFGENGKSEYYYTSVYKSELDGNTEFIDLTVSQPPFGSPEEDNDWKRGQLVNKIDYKYQLGSFIKIHETINTYQVLGSEIIATGFKAFMTFNDDECKSGDQRVFANSWKIKKGNLSYVPYYTIEKNYNTDGVTYSETRTDFTFNEGNRQLAESIVTFNNNAAMPWKRSTKLKYPSDYTFSSATAYNMALALSNMANVKHIHNAVIEKQIWEIQNGSNKLIDAEINLYKANGVELDKQMKLQTQIPLTVYTPSYLDVSNNFVYESSKFRELVSYNLYDNLTGNILEATGSDGIKRSFLWGYQNIYPIAEAINASNDNICYTSFEESTVGGWAINPSAPLLSGNAKTGSQYFIGSVETNSTLVVGIYNVSFWAKGTGDIIINGSTLPVNSTDWAYYSRSISLPSSSKVYFNSNSIPIDELRVYPNAAQMKTFTYSPLVGQTSVTDYNSTSTNYLYDDFNRLKSVSDNKASILKTLTYNQKGYSGPPPPSSLIASFSVTGTKKTGKTLTFTPVNTVSGVSYLWDFGDGMTLSSQNPSETHIYTAPGIYIVQLTVSKGTDSNNSQKSLEINIPVITDPNWPGPELTVNILPFFSPGHPLNGQLKVNVSATAAAGGQQPYKEYRWLIHSRDGSFESLGVCSVYIDGVGIVGCEDGEIVTTSPNASFILPQVQSEQIVTGLPPYSIISRVVGANDIASQATNSLGH